MRLSKASTNEEILEVLNQVSDAITTVLANNTNWGLSGLRHTQYSVDVDCDNAALAILHGAGCAVLSEESQITGEWGDNDRGVSYIFSDTIVKQTMERFKIDLIVRGHQVLSLIHI